MSGSPVADLHTRVPRTEQVEDFQTGKASEGEGEGEGEGEADRQARHEDEPSSLTSCLSCDQLKAWSSHHPRE
jgi:hypothetical protein